LLENLRLFNKKRNRTTAPLSTKLSVLGEIYVNDAFSTRPPRPRLDRGHRQPPARSGRKVDCRPQLEAPLRKGVGGTPKRRSARRRRRPSYGFVPARLLATLVAKVRRLIIAAAMANTFSARHQRRKRVREGPRARQIEILEKAKQANGGACCRPTSWWGRRSSRPMARQGGRCARLPDDQMILDVGLANGRALIAGKSAGVARPWCGTAPPIGALRTHALRCLGTNALAQGVASLTLEGKLLSVAGAGRQVAQGRFWPAVEDKFTYSRKRAARSGWWKAKTHCPVLRTLDTGGRKRGDEHAASPARRQRALGSAGKEHFEKRASPEGDSRERLVAGAAGSSITRTPR